MQNMRVENGPDAVEQPLGVEEDVVAHSHLGGGIATAIVAIIAVAAMGISCATSGAYAD